MKQKFEYVGGNHAITFTFQSETIFTRFCAERAHFRNELVKSLSGRFRYYVAVGQEFSDIVFYYRLNNKFFLVEVDGKEYTSMLEMEKFSPAMMVLFQK